MHESQCATARKSQQYELHPSAVFKECWCVKLVDVEILFIGTLKDLRFVVVSIVCCSVFQCGALCRQWYAKIRKSDGSLVYDSLVYDYCSVKTRTQSETNQWLWEICMWTDPAVTHGKFFYPINVASLLRPYFCHRLSCLICRGNDYYRLRGSDLADPLCGH